MVQNGETLPTQPISPAQRPQYPKALFEFLGQLPQANRVAYDCATGSATTAQQLTPYFENVIASDLCFHQVVQPQALNQVMFLSALAEKMPLRDQSIDLITVAQAWHWFDQQAFEQEAHRVLVPGGYVAIWGYDSISVNEEIDALLSHFNQQVLNNYWPAEKQPISQLYQSFPRLLEPLPAPLFKQTDFWNFSQLMEYVKSWSAIQRLIQAEGNDAVATLEYQAQKLWGLPKAIKEICWPITLRLARKSY